jgi:hypothetical protein
MEKSNKPKKVGKIVKDISLIAGGLALVGWSLVRTFNNYAPLSEKDYQNAKWYSSSVTPYEAYRYEKIPHNRPTWIDYQEAVKAKNGGSLKNANLYPDLDGNGKVAK